MWNKHDRERGTPKRRCQGLTRGLWAVSLFLAGCGGIACSVQGQEDAPAPAGPVLYTAAGSIQGLLADRDGRLWAATGGGVLCWAPGKPQPRRWTVADGLSSSDVRAVSLDADGVTVRVSTALGQDSIDASGVVTHCSDAVGRRAAQASQGRQAWIITSAGPLKKGNEHVFGWPDGMTEATMGNVTGVTGSEQGVFLATSLGLWRWTRGRWHALPLPLGSAASHVSTLETNSSGLLAGLYGDGVYRWNGQWQRLPGQPSACRFATALMQTKEGLAVGTQAEGVWREQGGGWQQCPLPPALPSADIGCLAAFHGALWAGSFDSGLLRLAGQAQTPRALTRADGLSSNSPRGLVVFGGALYVRGADGELDCSADGRLWHRAFANAELPRSQVYALGTDGQRLLLGGWAGWAATDGHHWERHYHDPELQGQVVTALAAQGNAVWIGTQKRGLLRWENGRYTAYQEAEGLTDDWITCLGVQENRLLVGTYTGGLLEKHAERFAVLLKPRAFAIRQIAFDPKSRTAFAATPLGLYQEAASGAWRLLDARLSGGLETQAVLPCPAGAWAATRASLAFVPRKDL